MHKPASADNNRADIIFLRDYQYGVMSNETVLRMADKDAHRKAIKKDRSEMLQPRSLLCMLCLVVHLRLMLPKLLTDAAALSMQSLYSSVWESALILITWLHVCLLPNQKPF